MPEIAENRTGGAVRCRRGANHLFSGRTVGPCESEKDEGANVLAIEGGMAR